MKNTITVVICTFNRSHLIKRTIDSVYNTSVDEIIVVNEGSNDEQSQKVVELLKSYPKIKYIYDPINNGFSHSKNTGCKAATSEWIMFLDDDDYFVKNPVAFWKSTMNQHPDADIIHHSIKDIQLNKSVQYWGANTFTLEEIKEHNRIPGSSLFKRVVWESLNGFRSIPYEDWDFWIRAKQHKFNFYYVPIVFYCREIMEDSAQEKVKKTISDTEWKAKYIEQNPAPIAKEISVCKIIDQFGWAFHFIAKDMQKYSNLKVTWQKYDKIKYDMNVLLLSDPYHGESITIEAPKIAKSKGIKVIGQYSGEIKKFYTGVDLIVTISPQTYAFAKKHYKCPVVYLPESIDTNFFTPNYETYKNFTVGWAGAYARPVKRTNLFQYLNYRVNVHSDHGAQFFKEDRTLDDMLAFYRSIDCFILTSESECQPRVVMEAMACGLPVIATKVGSVPLLLDKDWIVPVTQGEMIREMNKKLDMLYASPNLRFEVGERNRAWMKEHFSWDKNMQLWDKVFLSLLKDDYKTIEQVSLDFLEPFKETFLENAISYA